MLVGVVGELVGVRYACEGGWRGCGVYVRGAGREAGGGEGCMVGVLAGEGCMVGVPMGVLGALVKLHGRREGCTVGLLVGVVGVLVGLRCAC